MSDECAPARGLRQASAPGFLCWARSRLLEQANVFLYTLHILWVFPDLANVLRRIQAELRERKVRLGVPRGILASSSVNPETQVCKYLACLSKDSDELKLTCPARVTRSF